MAGLEKVKRKTFADILVDEGIVPRDIMKKALKEQWSEGIPIELYLINKGYVNEDTLISVLTKKFPLKYVDLSVIQPDPEAVDHIPYRIAKKYVLIPLRKSGRSLAVVMGNPLNREMVSELKKVTDLKIIPFVGRISEILDYIETYYSEEIRKEERIESPASYGKLKGEVGLTLQSNMNFDNFVVSSCNEVAYSFARSFAETRGVENTKLFIYGKEGYGKTHLINAVGNYILEHETFRGVLYTDALKFMDLLSAAKSDKDLKKFRLSHVETDVFLFDDLELLMGHDFAQNQLLYILMELHVQEKQFIFTSSKPLKELSGLNKKLISIIESSIVAPIEAPDKELKMKILEKKLANLSLHPKVLDLIQEGAEDNLRILNAIIDEVMILSRMGKDINTSVIKSILKTYRG